MSPEQIIGADAVLRLEFAGFKIVPADAQTALDVGDSIDQEALQWYALYPNKVGKPAALKAYRAARKRGATQEQITSGTARYIETKPADRPWCNPATFCNQDRFNDAPAQTFDKRDSLGAYREQLRREIADEGFGGHQGADRGALRPLARIAHDRR